ncbi:MAG: hypothetical protein OEL89_00545 [Candidatus Peregrinibacteria bacterium]|nr:hypothetical protein [Candidatus Peregrinibacteria bacterium]
MDETEKKIIGYGIGGNIAAIMALIGILTGMGFIPPIITTIIETLMAPNLAMIIMLIKYKFNVDVDIPIIPKIPVEPEPAEIPT